MPSVLKTVGDTIFKRRPLQSTELIDSEKYLVKAGQSFDLSYYTTERNHIRFTLLNDNFNGFDTWYAYAPHVEVYLDQTSGLPLFPKPRPLGIKLNVPYKSQLDNFENPTGACNVTAMAMCLEYFRIPKRTNTAQFEDELYRYTLDKGYSRWSPYDLAKLVMDYGCRDEFKTNATIEQVKDWVANFNPAVIHGYFTTFGHILVVVGYDEDNFIVHDPYGEWFESGYRTDLSGAYLRYSYRLIRRVCIPDGNFWVHFISK